MAKLDLKRTAFLITKKAPKFRAFWCRHSVIQHAEYAKRNIDPLMTMKHINTNNFNVILISEILTM